MRRPIPSRPTTDVASEVLAVSEGEESEGEESEAEGNADGAANGQQEVGQVEGGGEAESISIEQAIELKV